MAHDQVRTAWSFFTAPTSILETKDLTIHEKMTYIVIAAHADRRGQNSFPSYETIAEEGAMSRRHAIRCVASLIEKGYLEKEIRFENGENNSNLYTLYDIPTAVTPSHHSSDTQSPQVVTPSHHSSDTQSPKQIPLTDPLEQNPLTTEQEPIVVDRDIRDGLKQISVKVSPQEYANWISKYGAAYVLEKIAITQKQGSQTPLKTLRAAIRDNWIVNVELNNKNDSRGNSDRLERVVPAAQPGKYERFYQVYGNQQQKNSR